MTHDGPPDDSAGGTAGDTRSKAPRIVGFILLGLLTVGLLVLFIVTEAADATDDAWRSVLRWIDSFLRSPGLGGLAAVIAASVAFVQWRRQDRAEAAARADRDTADLKARRDQQWWDVFKLVYPASQANTAPPTEEERQLVDTLAGQADTEVQTAAAVALIGDLERREPRNRLSRRRKVNRGA